MLCLRCSRAHRVDPDCLSPPAENKYGVLSNFYKSPIKINDHTYPTVEHYFQSQKFPGTRHEKDIRNARSPGEAGEERSVMCARWC